MAPKKHCHLFIAGALVSVVALPLAKAWPAGPREYFPIGSSPNPVGAGARALGMGGAFIGVADDATAASWNPAGLVQLETPEISVVGAYTRRTEDITYNAYPDISGPHSVSLAELNYLSVAYPFQLFDHNLLVSLNHQGMYDFNRELRQQFSFVAANYTEHDLFTYELAGGWKTLSPAFAVRILNNLSLGLTLNIWDDSLYDNTWTMESHQSRSGTLNGQNFFYEQDAKDTYAISGLNSHLGLLWNLTSALSLGAVFKSPFRADITHSYRSTIVDSNLPEPQQTSTSVHETLDMPMSYGAGLALRLHDTFTLALDVYHTKWSDYVLHDVYGREKSPINGKEINATKISDTTQIRLGGEYLLVREQTVIPLRTGFFYDPEPWEDRPEAFWGVSVGSGIAYGNVVYDVAYQYRFGNDVRTAIPTSGGSSQDVKQHTVYMSVIYHF